MKDRGKPFSNNTNKKNNKKKGFISNNNNNKKGIRLLILILCFSIVSILLFFLLRITIFIINKGIKEISTPQEIEYSLKHIYSESLKKNIAEFIEKHSKPHKLSNFDPEKFYKKLKTKFKMVKKIKWDFTQPQTAKLTIKGVKPFFTINNKLVMGNKKRIFDPVYFEGFEIKSLNNVYLSPNHFDEKLNIDIYTFLSKIPDDIWQKYYLSYHKDSTIVLEKKSTKQKSSLQKFFLLNKKNFFDFSKLTQAKLLVKNLKEEWGNRFYWQKLKLFDLRFKDRILYRPLKEKPWGRE